MLDLYAAEPGNGKGYLLCEAALRLYRQGRDVFLFLDGTQKYAEKWEALEPEKGFRLGTLHFIDREWLLTPENYPTFGAGDQIESEGGLIPGCVLVVEEAHLVYANPKELDKSAGETPVHPRILRFFRQHRHFAKTLHDGAKLEMDILLDTQDIMSLHPTIRRVTRRTYVPENMGDRGMPNAILLRKYRGAKVTGNHQSFRVSKDMSVHDYYDSIKGGAPAGVHKVDSQKRGGYIRWYHKAFVLIPIALIGVLVWVGPKAYAVMTGHGASARLQEAQSSGKGPAIGAAKPVCKGSGIVLDVDARRVFYKGMWSDVGATEIRGGGTYWDVGPCLVRFSA